MEEEEEEEEEVEGKAEKRVISKESNRQITQRLQRHKTRPDRRTQLYVCKKWCCCHMSKEWCFILFVFFCKIGVVAFIAHICVFAANVI